MHMKRINTHLTSEQIDRLRVISAATGLTVAELIRRAVDIYIESRGKQHVGQRTQK